MSSSFYKTFLEILLAFVKHLDQNIANVWRCSYIHYIEETVTKSYRRIPNTMSICVQASEYFCIRC